MFTVLFAVARTVGWIAQWKEMIEDPHQKIGRPRQLYTGATGARLRADRQAVGGTGNSGSSECEKPDSEGATARPRCPPTYPTRPAPASGATHRSSRARRRPRSRRTAASVAIRRRDLGKAIELPGAAASVSENSSLELARQMVRPHITGRRIPARSPGRRSGWAASADRGDQRGS